MLRVRNALRKTQNCNWLPIPAGRTKFALLQGYCAAVV
jgi:hypothetical protein